ncbi:immunoglobulin-like domain-containing protein [Chitinophaga tropicalis]|uniref:Bacterial Ig-like domain-containing protein n=1 Tax=Chitinophaga tropicalis TaxID=2683588 RepID=A0A7K1UCK7_9BACT|nr:immunoglobulin-like domain-containing protein [Chitinophaga tropicalis]MVT12121.1 hypothetical protein [Chitinophaga tropicalis]
MRISLYYLIIPAFILGSCGNPGGKSASDSQDTSNPSKMQDTAVSTGTADPAGSIAMTVVPAAFKAGTVGEAKLTITNNAAEEITFGDPYRVEYSNNGNWEKVTLFDSVSFTAMAHGLAPGKSQEFSINLQPMPYDYKPGQYRILKDAQAGEKKIQLTAIFSVEQ